MKRLLKRLLPAQLHEAIRDLRELPPDARRAWVRAAWQRSFGYDLTRLPADLPPEPRVIFVCYGNIYRSPTAAQVFVREAARRGLKFAGVKSAGLHAAEGRRSPEDAQRAAEPLGISLGEHQSSYLSDAMIAESDLIVLMDRRNEALFRARAPEALARTVLLGAFDTDREHGNPAIADPYGKGASATAACFERIRRTITGLLDALSINYSSQSAPDTPPRRFVRRILTSSALLPLWAPSRRQAASILMLHRFADPARGVSGHDPDVLTSNLAYLRRHRFHICSLHDLVERFREGRPLVPDTVVFTVDDGYYDFAEIGAAIFAKFDVPATLFTVTSFVDGDAWLWYDVLRHCAAEHPSLHIEVPIGEETFTLQWRNAVERRTRVRRLIAKLHDTPASVTDDVVNAFPSLLGVKLPPRPTPRFAPVRWEQARALESQGMRFAPHTHTHPILSQTSAARVRDELETSWRRVQAEVAHPTPVLCFPSGTEADFTEANSAAAREAGLWGAVSAFGGRVTIRDFAERPFALPRLAYDASDSRFRWQVAGPRGRDR